MPKLRVAVVTSLWLAVLAACGPSQRAAEPGASPDAGARVRVENRGYADMVLYVLSSGDRIRLGTVTGNSTAEFPVPAYALRGTSTVRFLADPIGGRRTPVTQELSVMPGETVTLTILPQ